MKTSRQINAGRKENGLPPLNFKLFRKVIKRIEESPETYAQQVWGQQADKFNEDSKDAGGKIRPAPPCGTVACIAGEAIICSRPRLQAGLISLRRISDHAGRARTLLGLAYSETDLFGSTADDWIEPFRAQFQNAKTYRGEARAAINYLKYIIKTGKVTE